MDIDSPAPSAAPDQPQSTPADQGPAPTAASQPSPGAAGPSSTGKPASQHASPIPSASGADAASPAVDAQKSAQSGTESAAAEGHSSTEQQSQHPPSALASLASLAEARERGATPSSTASEHVAQGGLAESAAKPIANGHHNDDEAMDVIEDNETGGEHEHADHDATSSSSGSCPMSSVASGAATIDVPVANPEDSAEDMDRFIKRMEVEKVSQVTQTDDAPAQRADTRKATRHNIGTCHGRFRCARTHNRGAHAHTQTYAYTHAHTPLCLCVGLPYALHRLERLRHGLWLTSAENLSAAAAA